MDISVESLKYIKDNVKVVGQFEAILDFCFRCKKIIIFTYDVTDYNSSIHYGTYFTRCKNCTKTFCENCKSLELKHGKCSNCR